MRAALPASNLVLTAALVAAALSVRPVACFFLAPGPSNCRGAGTCGNSRRQQTTRRRPSARAASSRLFVLSSPEQQQQEQDDGSRGSEAGATRPDLPDYGKTSVEVDKIRLSKVSKKWRRRDLFGNSLVEQTLGEMKDDRVFQETAERYKALGAEQVTKEERANRRRALTELGVPSFLRVVKEKTAGAGLERQEPKILQINIGIYCNQACGHCHVESSPLRKDEMMSSETASRCLELLKSTPSITTLDVTGGAPELNANFRYLVRMARELRGPEFEIIDRCNLSVLQEPGQEDLVDFFKQNNVRIIASLPCYSEENVDTQRGNGVFERSIAALLALNEAGYGVPGTGLNLDLVYNPLGAFLPPEQSKLEQQYKQQLEDNFGILFNSLFTITNMPIKRFADFLQRRGELKEYMDLLVRNFNANATKRLMCLDMISVDWTGKLYDCDFNQQLGYAIGDRGIHSKDGGLTVHDVDDLSLETMERYKIRTDNHCFGCTAGMGSS